MKIIFLHIEKSAGTSQRAMLKRKLGNESVAWFEIDWKSELFDVDDFSNALIIGGHRKYNFYNRRDFIYLAVVREPVSRVLSLYNYYRDNQLDFWSKQGLDPSCINNTIRNCEMFRRVINNTQCEYLSGTKSFDTTRVHILNNKYLISHLAQIDKFNHVLSRKLNLDLELVERDNMGRSGYEKDIALNEESKSALVELLSEDIKLFEYIVEADVFNTVPDHDWENLLASN